MSPMLITLVLLLAQDTPTPGSRPADPPKKKSPETKGSAYAIGLGTGEGTDVGKSEGESAALGLRTKQRIAGTEHGEVHAIAELRPASPVATGGDSHGTRPQEKAPALKSRVVFGFCAVTSESLERSTGKYLRAEIYLYRPGTKKGGTQDGKTPAEEFYHAVVENGRIVSELGDRTILKEFAALGADAWMKPFARPATDDAESMNLKKTVKGILSRAVEDVVRGAKGNGDPRMKDLTKIVRDDAVKGASGRDESGD